MKGLMYADDLVIFADSRTEANKAFKHVVRWCQRNGMCINYSKCGYMQTGIMHKKEKMDTSDLTFTEDGETVSIPYVEKYKYLGLVIDRALSYRTMMEGRRDIAKETIAALQPFFQKRSTTLSLKVWVLMGVVVSRLLYGCEVWAAGSENMVKRAIMPAFNDALRALSAVPHNSPVGVLRFVLGVEPVQLLIARRVINARRRWAESGFPVRELMLYDVEFFRTGQKLFFDEQWAFVKRVHASPHVPEHVARTSNVYSDMIRRYAYALQLQSHKEYVYSGRLLAKGYVLPCIAPQVTRLRSSDFLAVTQWLCILCASWKGCSGMAACEKPSIDPRYTKECPFCGSTERGEDISHFLLECSAWQTQRDQILFGGVVRKDDVASPVAMTQDSEGWDSIIQLLRGPMITSCDWYRPLSKAHKDNPTRREASGDARVPVSVSRGQFMEVSKRLANVLAFVKATGPLRRAILYRIRTEFLGADAITPG